MDLGQIEAFIKVADYKSFMRASEALHLTQPSVTARIQALERDLGEELFERTGRGARLTDAGLVFSTYANLILKNVREGRAAVDEVRNIQLGSLRVGSAFTISAYVLPHILSVFRSRFSGIDMSVRTGHSEQVIDMLMDDDIEVGIARTPNHPEIESLHLYDDQIAVIVDSEHPLANTRSSTCADVASESVLLFSRGSSYHSLIKDFFQQASVVPRIEMELDSLESIKRMVEEGLGIALVPRVTVARELLQESLVEVEIVDAPPISRPISLAYHRTRRRSRAAQAFIDIVCEIYKVTLPLNQPSLT